MSKASKREERLEELRHKIVETLRELRNEIAKAQAREGSGPPGP